MLENFVKGMVDGKFIHECEIYDFSHEQYLLVCKFSLNLYEIVFFLPAVKDICRGKNII